jgi:hypothetical protein
MAYRDKKYAKCPKCCPDAPHACFKIESVLGPDDSLELHWICNNCWHDLGKVRHQNPKPGLTKRQRSAIKFLRRNFGGVATWEFIGRKVYLKLDNPKRPWYDGRMAGGIVGPRGAYKITLYRLGGDKEITNGIEVSVYLRQEALRKLDLEQERRFAERIAALDLGRVKAEVAGGRV